MNGSLRLACFKLELIGALAQSRRGERASRDVGQGALSAFGVTSMTTLQDAGDSSESLSRNGTRYALIVMDTYDRCHSVLGAREARRRPRARGGGDGRSDGRGKTRLR